MSKLIGLMRRLGSDAALAEEYARDPEAVLQRAGLTEEEHRAMAERDYAAVKRLTGLPDGKFATNHTIKLYEE
ncbi:hypothetical protein QF205_06725 [Luteimonas composti]|uniref:Extradiol ring-cleavage dioxygenase LigAB LigA subunit domain-containing protein n=1 Tax=Luteimonas composti TaxID=398257 RepID=A0ABT6MQ76_9GAMM|nr:hypothetical protein [Luteimonas composti]MDH7452775.1 hypothetical protein [Luteimonas composti]